ncbi:MAG: Mrp/NBP35 family ATP-binding protein [Acuticoccus sp.]
MVDNGVTIEAVEAALREVFLADGSDLMSSGRVGSLVVKNGRVGFTLTAAEGERAAMEAVQAAAEARVGAIGGVERVLCALVAAEDAAAPAPAPQKSRGGIFDKVRRLAGSGEGGGEPRPAPTIHRRAQGGGAAPAAPSGPAPGARRAPAPKGPVEGIRHIVAVGAGKGGVGKSTVSFNIAVALDAMGWRVGLLDADIYGPSVPTLMGAERHNPAAPGGGFRPFEAHGVKANSIGFLVAPEKAMIWRGPMVTGALNQLMRDTKWGELDCLIVDMPPGTGDIALSLAQQAPLSGAVVVTTPQDLSLIDVRKAAAMFRAVEVPILGMVENMSGFVCPKCGEETDIFGRGGGEREAATEKIPFLGRIALAMAVREASDTGRPVALEEGAVGEAYRAIASGLMAALADAPAKPFPAIVFE